MALIMKTYPSTKTTPEQRVMLWADLVDACEQFLLMGLRRKVKSEKELQTAYRQWYQREREEHDRTVVHMLEELTRREGGHAR